METKKLGFLIVGMSIVLGFIMFSYMNQLGLQGQQLRCNPTQECQQVNSLLGTSHIAVGFLSFIFALGFYLLFFDRSAQEVLQEDGAVQKNIEENAQIKSSKFDLLLRPLDDNERRVLIAIKEQNGITQATLRYRANLSKAKISQVLTDFEKKNLISKKAKGKTYQVFLTENF
ncbi:MAG: MarR family transcriptional regulator [Nanoarchaeota archaeon]